jgi:hypothetical protein
MEAMQFDPFGKIISERGTLTLRQALSLMVTLFRNGVALVAKMMERSDVEPADLAIDHSWNRIIQIGGRPMRMKMNMHGENLTMKRKCYVAVDHF